MDYKKILLPLVLLVLLTVAVSTVSAADVADNSTVSLADSSSNSAINDVSVYQQTSSQDSALQANATTHIVTAGSNTSTIQKVIDNATAGDTISFEAGEYKNIDGLNVTKQLNLVGQTTGVNGTHPIFYGLGDGNSNTIINVVASNVSNPSGTTISGIGFVMTQNNASKANDNGYGVYCNGVSNISITDCAFINGSAGVYFRTCKNCLINDSYFKGVTESITHDGTKEKGTKAINIMGGSNITVSNNIVRGNVLDAVSVASNAQYINVIGNYFYNASYGMFFGGGVGFVTINNNTFDSGIADAISLTKSSTTTTITNNTFKNLKTNKWTSTVIYSEAGNTAHGYPSPIGNITITGNTFEAAEGQDAAQITAYEIYSNDNPLTVTGAIVLDNNTYNNVTPFKYFQYNWGNANNGTVIITPEYSNTTITADNFTEAYGDGKNFTATLTDANGLAVVGEHVALNLTRGSASKVYWATTDTNGQVQLPINLGIGDYTVTYTFAGCNDYNASTGSASITVTAPENKTTTTLTVNSLTEAYGAAQNLTGKLVANGAAIVGQHIALKLTRTATNQSKVYYRTTDTNGEYQIPIELSAGAYTVTATYDGTSVYSSANGEGTITVTA